MDAATLRIILLVIGIAFLVALFFWERHRKAIADADADPTASAKTRSSAKREPNLGLGEDESPYDDDGERAWYDQPPPDDTDSDRSAAASPYPEAPYPEYPVGEINAADLIGTMTETEDGPIVQVFLVARDGSLSGRDILAAASRHLLIAGKKAIFHRYDGDPDHPHILFSMANLVQPGSFPLHPDPIEAMAEFETRGISLFTQVRGEPQDIESLDTMLTTAKSLARELAAEVEDAQHRPITVKRIESLRTCVLSYGSTGENPVG